MNAYDNTDVAKNYLEFLSSENGKIQQEVLADAILRRLDNNPGQKILDAACGSGWLAGRLLKTSFLVEACDGSEALIAKAKTDYPSIKFQIADCTLPLPYSENSFDIAILNMAILDFDDVEASLASISRTIKNQGHLIITLPNPYYNYPIGVWKSGFFEKLKRKKPSLKLQKSYFTISEIQKSPTWGKTTTSYIRPLSDYINQVLKNGFALKHFEDIFSKEDSKKFNLKYQMHRFPLLLLLEFKKI